METEDIIDRSSWIHAMLRCGTQGSQNTRTPSCPFYLLCADMLSCFYRNLVQFRSRGLLPIGPVRIDTTPRDRHEGRETCTQRRFEI